MKYTNDLANHIAQVYQANPTAETVEALASENNLPARSIIAKLASMGVYKKKEYRDKAGNVPIKKEEYIEKLANLLEMDIDLLESLTKVNKVILKRIIDKLEY